MLQSLTEQRVYIIDDDTAVRDAMSMLLESDSIAHSCFESAVEFMDFHNADLRGCLVLDIRMPDMSGLELQSELKKLESNLPIIFITGHGDVPMAVEAMRQGALDFMRKPISETDLLDRIQQALDLESDAWAKKYNQGKVQSLISTLTERENEVFQLVADGRANKVIAIQLSISERTVEVHRSRVMKKLEVRTLVQLVRIHLQQQSDDGGT